MMDQTAAWKNVLDAHYMIYSEGIPCLFREKFNILKKKVEILGTWKRPLAWIRIQEIVRDADLITIAFLCYMVESEACGTGEDKTFIAFEHMLKKLPTTDDQLLGGPMILFEPSEGGMVYFLVHGDLIVELTSVCEDAPDALLTLFKYCIVNSIPFPPMLSAFFNFVYFHIAAAPVKGTFIAPSPASDEVHDTLIRASRTRYFKALRL